MRTRCVYQTVNYDRKNVYPSNISFFLYSYSTTMKSQAATVPGSSCAASKTFPFLPVTHPSSLYPGAPTPTTYWSYRQTKLSFHGPTTPAVKNTLSLAFENNAHAFGREILPADSLPKSPLKLSNIGLHPHASPTSTTKTVNKFNKKRVLGVDVNLVEEFFFLVLIKSDCSLP